MDATTKFFEQLGARGHEPLLEKARGSVRFDLTDDGRKARWLVEIDKGDVTVSHRNVKADCTVSADKTLFDRIASGRENAMAAALRGEVGIDGERELLVWFQRLFPSPPRRKS